MRVLSFMVACALGLVGCSDSSEKPKIEDSDAPIGVATFSTTPTYPTDSKLSYTNSTCNIESINRAPFGADRVTVARTSPLVLTGWAYDDGAKRQAKSLHVVLFDSDGKARYFARGGQVKARPDVGRYLGQPDLVDIGFEAMVSASRVDVGKYRVVLGIERVADIMICDVGRSISVQ